MKYAVCRYDPFGSTTPVHCGITAVKSISDMDSALISPLMNYERKKYLQVNDASYRFYSNSALVYTLCEGIRKARDWPFYYTTSSYPKSYPVAYTSTEKNWFTGSSIIFKPAYTT